MSQFKHSLHGDGIHDDTLAIQERIDSGSCEVALPAPFKHYLISKPLLLPSSFKLSLPRFAEIKLADGSNCPMLMNRLKKDQGERLPHTLENMSERQSLLCRHLWYFVNEYSPEVSSFNIEIEGGIWNFNNLGQNPNPEWTRIYEPDPYTGDGMLFYGVKGITLRHMTFKDPVHYGAVFDRVSYFTVEDITFDYNLGNPVPVNMDGVHFNGNCHYGVIRNLKGTCYDDLVALNAHEGSKGPITHIEIDGLFAENCHSAVRLLTVSDKVENISIRNVYGSYYQYCIGLSKGYKGEFTGSYNAITLDGIYASKAKRLPVYQKEGNSEVPLIYVEDKVQVKDLTLTSLYRQELHTPIATVYVGENVQIERMSLEKISIENHTGKEMPLIENRGTVKQLIQGQIFTGNDKVLHLPKAIKA